LGEEPDGQYVTPEDFGALYLQWTDAIHRVDPAIKLGGPSFQEILIDRDLIGSPHGNSEWLSRFLVYLKHRGRSRDFSFFSFEWYPFDDVCEPAAPQLAQAAQLLKASLREMERRGLPRQIPWIISEYGYSAFGARVEIDIEGALLNADTVGTFLSLGGDQTFLFGYTPGENLHELDCTSGNNMLFSMDDSGRIKHRFATYYAARMITQEWLKPGDEIHEMLGATSDARDAKGNEWISVYAVGRPDKLLSVLLINKDPIRSVNARIALSNDGGFKGTVDVYQYSRKQYLLGGPDRNPYPVRAEDPSHTVIQSADFKARGFELPPYSLTIVRGALGP
jgi:hypothetical protein